MSETEIISALEVLLLAEVKRKQDYQKQDQRTRRFTTTPFHAESFKQGARWMLAQIREQKRLKVSE